MDAIPRNDRIVRAPSAVTLLRASMNCERVIAGKIPLSFVRGAVGGLNPI